MPHKFTDSKNREWTVVITIATVEHVRKTDHLEGIDLLNVFEGGVFEKLAADLPLFVRLLAEILAADMATANVDGQSFAEGLAGDALGAAIDAFANELTDFFPRAAQREAIRTILDKTREVETLAAAKIKAKTNSEEFSQAINKAIDQAGNNAIDQIRQKSAEQLTVAPSSSESNPAR